MKKERKKIKRKDRSRYKVFNFCENSRVIIDFIIFYTRNSTLKFRSIRTFWLNRSEGSQNQLARLKISAFDRLGNWLPVIKLTGFHVRCIFRHPKRAFSETATADTRLVLLLSVSPILCIILYPVAGGVDCQNSSFFVMFAPPRCVILLTLNLTEGQDDLSSRRLAGELVNSDLRANETWRSRKSRTIPLLPCSWANWTVSKRSMCSKRKEIRGRLPEKGSFYENWKITIIFKDFFSMKNILYISFDSSSVMIITLTAQHLPASINRLFPQKRNFTRSH